MSDIENWIRLAKLESPRKATALAYHFGGPGEVFHAKAEELACVDGITRGMIERIRTLASEPVDREIKALDELGAKIVTQHDSDYPQNLRQIYDPPVILFVRGELKEEDRFAVAIVGTRRPSQYGRSMALKLGRDLANEGLCVVSGGARGIDTIAHRGALEGGGRTIAVLGCGLDVSYPPENMKLFDEISEKGAVITEFVPGTKPDAWRFPVRNRLVSGLALGVLVVESLITGGAMITATLAGEQGRDIWAVPGSADAPVSEGPHRLIKDGAKLVERVEDILEELGIQIESDRPVRPKMPDNLTPEQKAIIEVLSLHPKHVDEIIGECKLTPAVANSTLTLLEMQGLVRRVPGNAYVRAV